MESIELGMSDMYILENYNLVRIITDYNMKTITSPVLMRRSLSKPHATSHRLFCYCLKYQLRTKRGNTIIEMMATFVLMIVIHARSILL